MLDERITIKLTPAEKAAFARAAKKAGLSMSSYLRSLIMKKLSENRPQQR